jgi:hypothetical protein
MDFIDAHRLDRELRESMKGMKPAEREKYLKGSVIHSEGPFYRVMPLYSAFTFS